MIQNKEKLPIYVDLDGTLAFNDQIWEAVFQFLKKYPLKFFLIFWWFFQGKPILKKNLVHFISFDPNHLPYNYDLISFLKTQIKKGVELYLITGAPQAYADQIAQHLGLFKAAYGTQDKVNLVAESKLAFIQKNLSKKRGFIYAGNSNADIPIWKNSQEIIAINPNASIRTWVLNSKKPYYIYDSKTSLIQEIFKMMRPYQWVKNTLIFLPLLLSFQLLYATDISLLALYPVAFLSFSLACSAVYIFNDILDIQDDRLHPRKCYRPLAKGTLSIPQALTVGIILFCISFILGSFVPNLGYWVIGYMFLTTIYTFKIKYIPFADILLLAILYVYRIIVGCIIGGLFCSHWILAFSFFLFLGLAFLKRYVELYHTSKARGYMIEDQSILKISGIISGFIAFFVFMLYIDSNQSHYTFQNPIFLWLMIPGFIYGYLKCWQAALRGKMTDDPILYIFSEKSLLYTLGFTALCFGAAKYVGF